MTSAEEILSVELLYFIQLSVRVKYLGDSPSYSDSDSNFSMTLSRSLKVILDY